MPENQAERGSLDGRTGLTILKLGIDGLVTCLTPFLRRGFGTEAFGANAVVALVIILLYAAQTHDPVMIWFLWAWVAAVIVQRVETFQLVRKGRIEHSRYAGYPVLALKMPFVKNEVVAKNCVEPLVCVVFGIVLCTVSESMGRFVMFGFVSLLVQRGMESRVNMNRVRRLRDAEIEQRYVSDLFHGRRDDF
jgi:hypothetical protein